jgi:hypothetical protein
MAHTEGTDIPFSGRRRAWQEFPQAAMGKLHASLKPSGFISISGWTHERMGSPDGYLLLFDRRTRTIGLRAARLGVDENAYPASQKKSGSNKNRTIFVRPLCLELGIRVESTVVFQNCEIDRDGVLVLDLSNTRPNPARKKQDRKGLVHSENVRRNWSCDRVRVF